MIRRLVVGSFPYFFMNACWDLPRIRSPWDRRTCASFFHSMWYLSMSDDWLAPSRYSWATVSPRAMPDSPSQRLFRETVREPTISWRLERTDCRDLCRRVASFRSVISCQDFSIIKISDWVQTGNPLRKRCAYASNREERDETETILESVPCAKRDFLS